MNPRLMPWATEWMVADKLLTFCTSLFFFLQKEAGLHKMFNSRSGTLKVDKIMPITISEGGDS